MNKNQDIGLEFTATVLQVGLQLEQNALLYWARNHDELLKILSQKNNFEPITSSDFGIFKIPEIPETARSVLWRRKIIDRLWGDQFCEKVPKVVGVQNATSASYLNLNIELQIQDVLKKLEVSGLNELENLAFSFSQIAKVASMHHRSGQGKDNLLDYDNLNYFPLIETGGNISILSLFSCKNYDRHVGWKGHFVESNALLRRGRLVLKNL